MMLGRRPRLYWIEIDGQAHILNGDKRTYCGLPLTHASMVMIGQREGCVDCISAFAKAHTEPELVPLPDEWEIEE